MLYGVSPPSSKLNRSPRKIVAALPCRGYRVSGVRAARWNCERAVRPAREKRKAMKKTLITIAFAAASLPMFAAQTPANPPANGTTATKPAKTKKVHHKKASKKSKATPAAAPASK